MQIRQYTLSITETEEGVTSVMNESEGFSSLEQIALLELQKVRLIDSLNATEKNLEQDETFEPITSKYTD